MMKLLFDLEALQFDKNNKFDGGAEYTKVIFFALIKKLKIVDLYLCFNPKLEIPKDVKLEITNCKIKLLEKKTNLELSSIIKEHQFDRFYSAIPYEYKNVDFGNVEVFVTVHGLRPLELPSDKFEYKYANLVRDNIKGRIKYLFNPYYHKRLVLYFNGLFKNLKNANIITVSEHTKYSIFSYFPFIKCSNVKGFYSPEKKTVAAKEPNYWKELEITKKKYFLLVSGKRWIKNSYRALLSFDKIFNDFPDFNFKVVCLGSNKELFRKRFQNPNFVFVDYVESEHLEFFYKNAYSFVYPTLNEGFGYPPLEAMKYGIPVLSSYVNSITEICKDTPLYFNPYSVEEIENRILNIYFDKELYQNKSKESFDRYIIVKNKQVKDLHGLIEYLLN